VNIVCETTENRQPAVAVEQSHKQQRHDRDDQAQFGGKARERALRVRRQPGDDV
jgi:hypothetical protein